LRILFDKNVPVGVRRFLAGHEVRTVVEMGWPPQLENGELLKTAEMAAFAVLVTSDQNIPYQQDLTRFRPSLEAGHTAVSSGGNSRQEIRIDFPNDSEGVLRLTYIV
jgi:hypothetical protein